MKAFRAQIPPQSRGCVSGRTTPLNDYEGDILEENPQYKNKAPPHPVVHRRTSIEWENFEEAKASSEGTVPMEPVARAAEESCDGQGRNPSNVTKPSEEDEPMFSEDMSEERRRAQAAKFAAKEEETKPVVQEEEANVDEHQASNGQHSAGEPESELETAVAHEDVTPALPSDPTTADTTAASEAAPEAAQPTEASEVENQEAAYDPNAYPGYIWNYETQQWDVDPNYDPTQHQTSEYAYQYDGYSATTQGDGYTYPEGGYDQAYGQTYAYDQAGSYTSSTYPVGADASPYDQGSSGYPGYDQTTYAYDQPGSQAGYDTTAAGYDQQYTDAQGNGYVDTSYYGYNQNPVDYSEPPIGDPSANDYDTSATTTDISAGYGYDQPGYSDVSATGAGATTYDYSSASYGSSSAAPDAAVYAYDQGGTEYGTSAATAGAPTDYSSYSHDYPADYSNYQYSTEPTAQDYSGSSQPEAGASHPYPTQQLYQSVSEKPQPPPFTQPLFQSAPTSDPFAWDAVAHEPQAGGSTGQISEQHSPSRPPPPSRPAPPKHPRTGAGDEQVATAHLPPPRPPPASSPSAPPPRPGPPSPKPPTPRKVEPEPEPEEDAWTAFKKLTEKSVTRRSEVNRRHIEKTRLSETTAVKDIKDESYLGQV
ncbi:hypothetical protein OSTOST_14881, partial [Ostertagia ostertagi]